MDPIEVSDSAEKRMCILADERNIPINGILELTPLCNMNCDMCYVRLSKQQMEVLGGLRSGAEWLKLGREMANAGTLFILLTGGEPLMHPDFKEIYLGLKKLGMIITINTNATLINEEWASFFGKHKPRRMNITLYGPDRETYDRLCNHAAGFDDTIRAIKLLKSQGVDIKLNGSITPQNRDDAERIINIACDFELFYKLDTYMYPGTRERSVAYNQAARLSPEEAARVRVELMKKGKSSEEFEESVHCLMDKLNNPPVPTQKIGCRAGSSSFAMNWQGEMRPCIMVNQPSMSVFENGFSQSWTFITKQTSEIRLSSKCAFCDMRGACQVCAACALLETGKYSGTPEYMCRYTKESVRILREAFDEFENE